MFYIATNQICSTTGIQEDSIKSHNHSISHTHGEFTTVTTDPSYNGLHTHKTGSNKDKLAKFNIYAGVSNSGYGTGFIKLSNTTSTSDNDAGIKNLADQIHAAASQRNNNIIKNLNEHSHDITSSGSHSHKINITAYIGYSQNSGETETRPENRLFRIWRRIL